MIKIRNQEGDRGVTVACFAIALVEVFRKLQAMGILMAILAFPGGPHEHPDPGARVHDVAAYAGHCPVCSREGEGTCMPLLRESGREETSFIVTVRAPFPGTLKLAIVGIIMTVFTLPGSTDKFSYLAGGIHLVAGFTGRLEMSLHQLVNALMLFFSKPGRNEPG